MRAKSRNYVRISPRALEIIVTEVSQNCIYGKLTLCEYIVLEFWIETLNLIIEDPMYKDVL